MARYYAGHRYFPASSTGHLRHILFRTKVTQNLYYVCSDKRHVARNERLRAGAMRRFDAIAMQWI